MNQVVLALRGASKTFGSNRALSQVDMDVRRGEVHALVGENGSGKSTLIKILSGYHSPDPGAVVEIDGVPLRLGNPEHSRRAGLRFVHQDLGLIDEFTALENFGVTGGFPTKWSGIDWGRLRGIAEDLLARVGTRVDLDTPVGELTAVERSAVAIARCLDDSERGEAKVLVLDEPTAALPVDDVSRLFDIVREVADRGVAVMYVSHRLDEVMELSQRITVLRDGQRMAAVDTESIDRGKLAELIVGSVVSADDIVDRAVDPTDIAVSVKGYSTTTLRPVDFAVARGEIVGVAGLDGSGRETFARGFVGDAGGRADSLVLAGEAVPTVLSPRAAAENGVALVLANRDEGAAVRGLSIAENITLADLGAVSSRGFVSRKREATKVDKWIEALEIRPAEPERDYGTLSGGNRQKVVFAKWLNVEPRLLVLDDPTSGVDVGARRAMYGQVRDVAVTGVPVVVVSSDLEDLVRLCDRVLVLAGGRIVAELTGEEISEYRMTVEMSNAQSAGEVA
ncbi:sugar ABC transporter ATP-binding protein [Salinibacterium sp. ZJ70]|uniref:sugar ABC transporter ATP-binding protein n=1 Tax=Salinibacterium sp. ZJ70 TaxID=2708084 RepID=UPI0014238D11|nr:sugar ABC transporter ATP-binding protein [Salinibacterium sp. ZJ70]